MAEPVELPIYIAPCIRTEAEAMNPAQRAAVEREKAQRNLDDALALTVFHHRQSNAGISVQDDATIAKAKSDVANSFDLIISVIALCENIHDVERVKKIGVILGRQHKTAAKLNEQEIIPKLRKIYASIAKESSLHEVNDKILLRRKITATVTLLNDSLRSRRTR
jgi:hypothetical protein